MKIIGFNAGQYGDLAMQTICCRAIKSMYPFAELTFGIGDKFQDAKDVFLNQPFIDKIHIWDSYNAWPTEKDKSFIMENKFDLVFNAMPPTYPNWYNKYHQIEAVCLTHQLPIISKELYLNRYFNLDEKYKNYVSLAGFTSFGNKKNISMDKLKNIIDFIKNAYNLNVISLSSPNDPNLDFCENFKGTFFDAVKIMLSTKFLLSLDTGLIWYASCYKHPVIGLYGHDFYPTDNSSSVNWQPINLNATYLQSNHPENIENKIIFDIINRYCE